MATTKTPKATTDSNGRAIYLRVSETREGEYFHLRASVCVQQLESSHWQAYGPDDCYGDGLLWSGLRVSCQGDARSQLRALGAGEQGPVYGWDTEYRDVFSVDLRKVRRMQRTLEKVERGLSKLREKRGSARSYGEYLGRVAEVLGCAGMAFDRSERGQRVSGERWDWMSIGDGVNRADHRVYLWQQELVEREAQREPLQLQGDVEAVQA